MCQSAGDRLLYIACASLAVAAVGCGDGTRPAGTVSMLNPNQPHYGKTYSEWAVEYMKWQFETPFSILADIKACTPGQDMESAVVFLGEEQARHTEPHACELASQKPIFLPLLRLSSPAASYYVDSALVPSASAAELQASVDDFMRRLVIEEAVVSVDGRTLQDPLLGRIEATRYSYAPDPADSALFEFYGVADPPPVVDPAYVSGYWLLLSALRPGQHELFVAVRGHTGGANIQVIREQYTYHLTQN